MKSIIVRALVFATLAIGLADCISAKSYVDPTYSKATYDDLHRVPVPQKWKITVQFDRQGAP
jgi:hypothetical protein